MSFLAICKTCKFAFVLPEYIEGASCPKPDCDGTALVSDGSYAHFFKVFHEVFPTAMDRKSKRDIQSLARKMAAGKITPEEALERSDLSPEAVQVLSFLVSSGIGLVGILLMLLTLLQTKTYHEEDQRDRERDQRAQRETYQLFYENFEQLHRNEEQLSARLNRVQEAFLAEEEEAPRRSQAHSLQAGRAENASLPKQQSSKPPAKKKKKKGKKRA